MGAFRGVDLKILGALMDRLLFVFGTGALLGADERHLVTDSTTNSHRREYRAGNHEGKRKTNESKNKAVFPVACDRRVMPAFRRCQSCVDNDMDLLLDWIFKPHL